MTPVGDTPLPITDLLRCIVERTGPERTVLVGIDGGAGAGKSTFGRWLAGRIEEQVVPVSVVLTDRIYRPVAERWAGPADAMPIGYDLDWERIRDEVILPLRSGRAARFQLYDWVTDRLDEWVEIQPGGVTIVDGVFALRRELADYYDLRLWFACPLDTRISRLLGRGDTSRQELESWRPIEERYHAAHAPEKSAHLVIDSSASMRAAADSSHLAVVRWSPPDAGRER